MPRPNKVSWADIHSDDSSSFHAAVLKNPIHKDAATTFPIKRRDEHDEEEPGTLSEKKVTTFAKTMVGPTKALPKASIRRPLLPVNADDSYATPCGENSSSALAAELKNFGVLIPKGGLVVEDSNTWGLCGSKREREPEKEEQENGKVTEEAPTKRARGPTSFPVDPVFGGPMPSRKNEPFCEDKK